MKKLFMLAVLILLPFMRMNGVSTYTFSAKTDVVYLGATEVRVLPLTNENGEPPYTITYSVPPTSPVASIDAESGIITLKGPGEVKVSATYKETENSRETTVSYNLIVIDSSLGQYRKVTDVKDLGSGENNYILVNKQNDNNFTCFSYNPSVFNVGVKTNNSYLVIDGSDNIYPQILTGDTRYQLKFNDTDIDNRDQAIVSSLECSDLENADIRKFVSYPAKKSGALELSNDQRAMTISYNDKGIKMSFVDTPTLSICYSSSKFQNLTNQTLNFRLYKHYGFDAPEGPKVMIGDAEITGTAYNITGTSESVAIMAPNDNVLVYYNWRPETSSENNVAKVTPEVNKWTKYIEPIQLSEAGTLEYYSEQYGKQSEHKSLTITKQSTPTSVTEMTVSDDTDAIYYTLDGQKLSGKPNTAGVYVILKDGKSKTLIVK